MLLMGCPRGKVAGADGQPRRSILVFDIVKSKIVVSCCLDLEFTMCVWEVNLVPKYATSSFICFSAFYTRLLKETKSMT